MPNRWKPDPNDPTSLAAFRWHVNRLENLAISIFVTDRRKYEEILEVFKDAAAKLKLMRHPSFVQQCEDNSDCAPGYVCVNGQCEPDFEFNPAARQTPSS
jgi:hypothetical protein